MLHHFHNPRSHKIHFITSDWSYVDSSRYYSESSRPKRNFANCSIGSRWSLRLTIFPAPYLVSLCKETKTSRGEDRESERKRTNREGGRLTDIKESDMEKQFC
ncbi:hypothetical protein J6590_062140 [Homalodisca vitripennis]|nr:hypothetical protein J6590_062140 [Homalodisca vitripennis]